MILLEAARLGGVPESAHLRRRQSSTLPLARSGGGGVLLLERGEGEEHGEGVVAVVVDESDPPRAEPFAPQPRQQPLGLVVPRGDGVSHESDLDAAVEAHLGSVRLCQPRRVSPRVPR
eukprot:CAMPEP_0119366688 /NCGR_PEP_ID=MMETSP1334-20130426/13524_1 /TAXON_ID=127549 /ORGANISM="Calcidiscus leptoporus, Strain RCC1130" /LENGTH=117 /DNA_ID=CAMNT_0007382947 /DNA_START=642 /DNA_END=992 /DNA_ORIENTATION=-